MSISILNSCEHAATTLENFNNNYNTLYKKSVFVQCTG